MNGIGSIYSIGSPGRLAIIKGRAAHPPIDELPAAAARPPVPAPPAVAARSPLAVPPAAAARAPVHTFTSSPADRRRTQEMALDSHIRYQRLLDKLEPMAVRLERLITAGVRK